MINETAFRPCYWVKPSLFLSCRGSLPSPCLINYARPPRPLPPTPASPPSSVTRHLESIWVYRSSRSSTVVWKVVLVRTVLFDYFSLSNFMFP